MDEAVSALEAAVEQEIMIKGSRENEKYVLG